MSILKKIKLNLEYEGRIITSEIPPYKSISYIKDLAKNIFYIKNKEIELIYINKDITQYENYIIGDFFKRKNPITIKVQTELINTNKSTNEIMKNKKYKLDKSNFFCSCGRDFIENYCRNCKNFICNICRINQTHIKHKISQIDIENLVESVKLYAITLQNDILLNIKKSEEYKEKINNENKNELIERHEIIKNKLDSVLNIYNNCVYSLNNNNNNIEKIINEYKNETNSTNKEIENIIQKIYNKYTKGKRNMTQIEFKNYFKLLSEKDDILQNQSNKIISFRVNDDFKRRMNLIYDKIEQILDLTLNAKNPLGIGNESNYLFNLILNNNNNNNQEENYYKEKEEKENNNKEREENEENNNNENEENNNNENEENNNNENEINNNNGNEDNNNEENKENNKEENNNDENEENNEESNDDNLSENDEERKKLNDIIDKSHLQEKEKNNLITMGVLNGN